MRAIIFVGALWFLSIMGFVVVATAWAHDAPSGWAYPTSCCSGYDCRQETETAVKEIATGYMIASTKELIPYNDKRVRMSPDGLWHACWSHADFDRGRVICLFAPPRAY
jgi:hypothetical protein